MKSSLFLLFLCLTSGFSAAQYDSEKKQNRITSPTLQSIIDGAGVVGAILIYDLSQNTYYSNDFDWAKTGQLPASTFKIPNTIIGLETGVIKNEKSIFEWDGKPKNFKIWEQDLILADAFHYSCVPCYQGVARQVGTEQMNAYLSKLSFGTMDVDDSNLDTFWLTGTSRINQFEQVAFLLSFYNKALPISDRTHDIVSKMMVIEKADAFQISGKTGWSVNGDINNGWFVGYLIKNGKPYFFASNIEPTVNFDMRGFSSIRKQITFDALRALEIQ